MKLYSHQHPLLSRCATDALTGLCSASSSLPAPALVELLRVVKQSESAWAVKDQSALVSLIDLIESACMRCCPHLAFPLQPIQHIHMGRVCPLQYVILWPAADGKRPASQGHLQALATFPAWKGRVKMLTSVMQWRRLQEVDRGLAGERLPGAFHALAPLLQAESEGVRFAAEQALKRLLTTCFMPELVAAAALQLESGRAGPRQSAAAVVATLCSALADSSVQAWPNALSGGHAGPLPPRAMLTSMA